jgi:hypothetical protein
LLNQKPKYPAIGGLLEENNAGASADLKLRKRSLDEESSRRIKRFAKEFRGERP